MDERERKRIADKVGMWDQLKVALTPGDVSAKDQTLSSIATQNEEEEERKRRAAAAQTSGMPGQS